MRRLLAIIRRLPALTMVALAAVLVMALPPATAAAHSLDSSTVVVRIVEDAVTATITLPLETLDATGSVDDVTDDDEIVAYVADHLTVTGSDDVWTETFSNVVREPIEGIESLNVDVAFESDGADAGRFTLDFDAIVDVADDHEVVVVLIDSAEDISTVGIIDGDATSLTITDGTYSVPFRDMVEYGFDHVLDGADHLLFLVTLLLPAPLVIEARRWRAGEPVARTIRKVVHVVTAFTIGHSVTLMASALGWVSVPSRPVEILIAVSVGISAIHAICPLVERGEEMIAVGFGLIHGLAFAGILDDLGLGGATSVLTLLAFNVGVELAQLATTAVVFPSLWALERTRASAAVRTVLATAALAASVAWALDRLGLLANPFSEIEAAAISHPWSIVAALALVAAAATGVDRIDADDRRRTRLVGD